MSNDNNIASPCLTRRGILGGIAAVTVVGAVAARANSVSAPTREDLEDYMLFLWIEHRRVAAELGLDPHDFMVMRRRDGKSRYDRACSDPASARALAVLSIAGLGGAA